MFEFGLSASLRISACEQMCVLWMIMAGEVSRSGGLFSRPRTGSLRAWLAENDGCASAVSGQPVCRSCCPRPQQCTRRLRTGCPPPPGEGRGGRAQASAPSTNCKATKQEVSSLPGSCTLLGEGALGCSCVCVGVSP